MMSNQTTRVSRSSHTYAMVSTALMTAVTCILAPLSVPIGPVPISFTNLAIYISLYLLDWKRGTVSYFLYLLIGFAGLPVFSGFTGGVAKLAGPTGGYLIGYIPCALILGCAIDRFPRAKWMYPLAMIAGTIVLYAIGVLWFMLYLGNGFGKAMAACVIPFLPGDALKIAVASIFSLRLRPLFDKKR